MRLRWGNARIDNKAMCLANQASQLADRGSCQAAKDILQFAEDKFAKLSQHFKVHMKYPQGLPLLGEAFRVGEMLE